MAHLEETVPVFDINQISEEITPEAIHIMEQLKEKVFYISELKTLSKFDNAIKVLASNMTYGFEHEEFRNCPVSYKFNRDDEDEEVKFMSFRHFIINLIMWRPQICLDRTALGFDHIIDAAQMTRIGPQMIKSYFDRFYVDKYNRQIPQYPGLPITEINGTLSEILGETTFILQRTVDMFGQFFGITINIEAFADLAKRFPEFDELMHFKLDELKQPSEMEKDSKEAMNKAIDIIIKDQRFNVLKPLFAVKGSVKFDQARDMMINMTLKPNFDGRTISRPVNTNLLAQGGFRDLADWYINAISGRKAAIINNEFMGRTGHLLILIAIATSNVRLSKTTLDCGSLNFIPIEIKSKTHLNKLAGRRFRHRGEKVWSILDPEEQKDLIGDTIEVRSPITCACKDGVCRECYGELYYTNIDNVVTGIYSATTVMNPVVQGILSAKHHQSTKTSPIAFGEEFNLFFSLASTDVILDISDGIDASEYSIILRREEIHLTDGEEVELSFEKKKSRRKKKSDDDDDAVDNTGYKEYGDESDELELGMRYYVTKFEVVKNLHTKGKHPEYIAFSDVDNKELFIHDDFITRMLPDSDDIGQFLYMDFEDINPDEFIFVVDVANNELTKPMKSIQRLLNNKDHEGCKTYQDATNKMLDLMIASELDAMSIHGEMIIRELIRRKSNTLKRPDFSKLVMSKDYDLITITTALKKNPSITTSISTPYLKHQLINQYETFIKDACSVFDPFFKVGLIPEKDPLAPKRREDILDII